MERRHRPGKGRTQNAGARHCPSDLGQFVMGPKLERTETCYIMPRDQTAKAEMTRPITRGNQLDETFRVDCFIPWE